MCLTGFFHVWSLFYVQTDIFGTLYHSEPDRTPQQLLITNRTFYHCVEIKSLCLFTSRQAMLMWLFVFSAFVICLCIRHKTLYNWSSSPHNLNLVQPIFLLRTNNVRHFCAVLENQRRIQHNLLVPPVKHHKDASISVCRRLVLGSVWNNLVRGRSTTRHSRRGASVYL